MRATGLLALAMIVACADDDSASSVADAAAMLDAPQALDVAVPPPDALQPPDATPLLPDAMPPPPDAMPLPPDATPLPDAVPPPDAAPPPDAPPPDAAPPGRCDTVDQTNCPDPLLPKCSVALSSANLWSNECRRQDPAAIAEGAMCARTMEGAPGVGDDNCAGGLYCTALGNADGMIGAGFRSCRRFCRSSAGCAATDTCVTLTDLFPPDGICIGTCTVFTNAGCTGAAFCFPATDINGLSTGYCQLPGGPGGPGDACPNGDECGAGNICISDGVANTCRPLCSASNPSAPACPAMSTCTGVGGLPADVGICLPN